MHEPKIILPAAALVSLYKDTLVLPEKEIKSAEKLAQEKVEAIGKRSYRHYPY